MLRSRWSTAAAAVVALGLAALYLTALLGHLTDVFGLDTAGSGAWLGLVGQGGVMPPPLHHGQDFAGTRYMPLPLEALAVLGHVLGDDIAAGKLISGASAIGCLVVLGWFLRREGASPAVIVICGLLLLGGPPGSEAVLGIHFDIQPATLQLLAVAVVHHEISRRRVLVAGALCGSAIALKLTSIWGLLAIAVWLLARKRGRLLLPLVLGFVAAVVVLCLPFEVLADGRPLTNLIATAASHEDPLWRLGTAFRRYRFLTQSGNRTSGPLLLAGVVSLVLATRGRRLTVVHVALVLSVVTVLPTFADRGITTNHLIDQTLLGSACLGLELARGRRLRLELVVVPVVLVVAALGLQRQWHPVFTALHDGGSFGDPLIGIVPRGEPVLSEDATVLTLRHESSVVADPFAYRRLAARRPSWDAELIGRLDRRDFAAVVLVAGSSDASRYRLYFFGSPVYQAIQRDYVFDKTVNGRYDVYLPRQSA